MRYYALIRRRGELVRLRQVMAVLFRHGFGHVVYALRLGEHVPFLNRALGRDEEDRPLTSARASASPSRSSGPPSSSSASF